MLNATITVEDKDGLVEKSFAPEDREIGGKASYNIIRKNGKTTFEISAVDSVALRIVANSITKMLTVIEKMRVVK